MRQKKFTSLLWFLSSSDLTNLSKSSSYDEIAFKVPWITMMAMSKLFMMEQFLKFGRSWLLVSGTSWCTLHQFLWGCYWSHCTIIAVHHRHCQHQHQHHQHQFQVHHHECHQQQDWLVQLKTGETFLHRSHCTIMHSVLQHPCDIFLLLKYFTNLTSFCTCDWWWQ